MQETKKYCKYCGVPVKPISRSEQDRHVGRGELPGWVHVTKQSDKDPVQCSRANLYERDVTEENWW